MPGGSHAEATSYTHPHATQQLTMLLPVIGFESKASQSSCDNDLLLVMGVSALTSNSVMNGFEGAGQTLKAI